MNYHYLVLFKKVSSILKDDRSDWEKFWDNYGHIVILCAVVFVILVVFAMAFIFENYLPQRAPKPKDTVMIDGQPIVSSKVCTITLVSLQEISLVKGTEFVAPLHARDGYEFGGWFYDTACTIPYTTTKIKKNTTLYPKWIKHS